eukprot:c34955_g1_i1 orf=1-279(+)
MFVINPHLSEVLGRTPSAVASSPFPHVKRWRRCQKGNFNNLFCDGFWLWCWQGQNHIRRDVTTAKRDHNSLSLSLELAAHTISVSTVCLCLS